MIDDLFNRSIETSLYFLNIVSAPDFVVRFVRLFESEKRKIIDDRILIFLIECSKMKNKQRFSITDDSLR